MKSAKEKMVTERDKSNTEETGEATGGNRTTKIKVDKLKLNKETVQDLSQDDMKSVRGAGRDSIDLTQTCVNG